MCIPKTSPNLFIFPWIDVKDSQGPGTTSILEGVFCHIVQLNISTPMPYLFAWQTIKRKVLQLCRLQVNGLHAVKLSIYHVNILLTFDGLPVSNIWSLLYWITFQASIIFLILIGKFSVNTQILFILLKYSYVPN